MKSKKLVQWTCYLIWFYSALWVVGAFFTAVKQSMKLDYFILVLALCLFFLSLGLYKKKTKNFALGISFISGIDFIYRVAKVFPFLGYFHAQKMVLAGPFFIILLDLVIFLASVYLFYSSKSAKGR